MKKTCILIAGVILCAFLAACSEISEKVDMEKLPVDLETEVTEETSEEPTEAEPELSDEERLEQEIDAILDRLTTEEKVAQLFVITPEALTGYQTVTQAKDVTAEAYGKRPVGGVILFAKNILEPAQIWEMNKDLHNIAMNRVDIPLWIAVDEEGGSVTRVAGNPAFEAEEFLPAYDMTEKEGAEGVYEQGVKIGNYLSEHGFDLDFAPVADVWSNPDNKVIGTRSYNSDPRIVAEMSSVFLDGLHENMLGCLKHFPGHGATVADSHEGSVQAFATLDEMRVCEFLPFKRGIENGVKIIMVGHIETPNVEESGGMPASLSNYMVTTVLREEMGFEGVVITDAMNMGAITQQYDSGHAAVAAIEAGVDIILMPEDFEMAYQGVCEAVRDGRITEQRVEESVRRILRVKLCD